jgi:hypothetical protein
MDFITNLLYGPAEFNPVPAELDFVEDEQDFYEGDYIRYTPHRNPSLHFYGVVERVDVEAREAYIRYYAPGSKCSAWEGDMKGWRSFDELDFLGVAKR